MLTKEKAEKYLDTLLTVLHAVDELVGDKLLPAEIALAGVKSALAMLDDDKIGELKPEDIRALAVKLRDDLKARDAAKDQKLHDKFDAGGEA